MSLVLEVRGLRVAYAGRVAVDGVDFELHSGEVLAVVGESGCGKTSLARGLAGLTRATAKRLSLAGQDATQWPPGRRGEFLQMVFQDPRNALNPRLSIATTLAEAMPDPVGRTERVERIAAILHEVGLEPEVAGRRPGTLSGGQAQRVAIARALLARPRLLVCDEAVSALDVLTRRRILDLLRQLQADRQQSLLFIAHDLDVVERLADRVLVMYAGRVVESGPVDQVFKRPAHPYTRALLAAIPRLDGARPEGLPGEAADPRAWAAGCAFAPRCPQVGVRCREKTPELLGESRELACWYPDSR